MERKAIRRQTNHQTLDRVDEQESLLDLVDFKRLDLLCHVSIGALDFLVLVLQCAYCFNALLQRGAFLDKRFAARSSFRDNLLQIVDALLHLFDTRRQILIALGLRVDLLFETLDALVARRHLRIPFGDSRLECLALFD